MHELRQPAEEPSEPALGEAGGVSLPGPTSGNARAAGWPATLLGRGQLERGLVAAPVEFGVNVRGWEQLCICVREGSGVRVNSYVVV